MSFSEALKFAEQAERARDLAWERLCEEEDLKQNMKINCNVFH